VVVRREASGPPQPSPDLAAVWSRPGRNDSWGEGRPSFPSPITAPPDVGRLTDQVIRAIDDRLIAWRERTGR
jgi:hypothetical protein